MPAGAIQLKTYFCKNSFTEHRHNYSFKYYLWLLLWYNGNIKYLLWIPYGPQSLKQFLSGSLQKCLPTPLLEEKKSDGRFGDRVWPFPEEKHVKRQQSDKKKKRKEKQRKMKNSCVWTLFGSDWLEHRVCLTSGKKYSQGDNYGPGFKALHA